MKDKTTSIALIQPQIPTGKSLGIKKAPESIMAIAGQLIQLGYNVKMFHEYAGPELYKKIFNYQPDFVGISTMTPNFPEGQKIAEAIKEKYPTVPIVLGGWHASGCMGSYLKGIEKETLEEILLKSKFDYAVHGEGEIVFPDLVRRLTEKISPKALKGLGYIKDGKIIASYGERIVFLDELAIPSWEGLDVNEYRDMRSGDLDLSVHFMRGCRWLCGFCSTPILYQRSVKTINAKRAVDYIEGLLEKYHPQVITFTDEDFFTNLSWVKEIVELLDNRDLNKKYGVVFDTFASIIDINRLEKNNRGNFLDEMKRAGFNSFTMGIESFNPKVLREQYNKELMILPMMTSDEKSLYEKSEEKDRMLVDFYFKSAQKAINFAQKHGILVVGDYMIGNMDETEEQISEGFRMFSNLKGLLIAYLPLFTPYPGTGLWEKAYYSGRLKRKAWTIDWASFDASAGTLELGYDVKKMRDDFEVEFYTSRRYYQDMRRTIKNNPEKIGMFRGRFNYLDKTFSENNMVRKRLAEINSM